MKKYVFILCLSAFVFLNCNNARAQKGFFDINVSYNKFTQTVNQSTGLLDLNVQIDTTGDLPEMPETPPFVKDHATILNIGAGYNFRLEDKAYLGFYLGYSKITSEVVGNDATFLSFTPKFTYIIDIYKKIKMTPNFYVSVGYGTTSLGKMTVNVGGLSSTMDMGDITKMNIRLGINPLSFDFFLSEGASVNLTLLTPYMNITKYSFSAEGMEGFTTKDIILLYGQAGFKFYINSPKASSSNTKNNKRRR